jgi:hypothetical protein
MSRPKKWRSRDYVTNDVLPSPVDFLNMVDVSSAWIVLANALFIGLGAS